MCPLTLIELAASITAESHASWRERYGLTLAAGRRCLATCHDRDRIQEYHKVRVRFMRTSLRHALGTALSCEAWDNESQPCLNAQVVSI